MSYSYQVEKKNLFTEENQALFLKIRDRVKRLLDESGAFNMQGVTKISSVNSWINFACVDRLVELGEIKEVPRGGQVAGQHRIFTLPGE